MKKETDREQTTDIKNGDIVKQEMALDRDKESKENRISINIS